MKYLIVLLSFLLVSCGQKGGSSDASPAQKSIWSTWTRSDNGVSLNLTGGSFNQSYNFTWDLSGGVNCTCQASVTGSESSGSWTMANCTGNGNCSALNGTGTFQRSSATQILFCDSACGSYQ